MAAIADNDLSLAGRSLHGITIVPPASLAGINHDYIVVTSISGRESIARQLKNMGYVRPRDFALIGRYPSAYQANFTLLRKWLPLRDCLPGSHCLHIGPGGFLGLEALLWAGGARKVSAIDKFAFGISYPDISGQILSYKKVENFLVNQKGNCLNLEKFKEVFVDDGQRTCLNRDLLDYRYPVDVEELPFADNSFDLACSFAVLEHVRRPERAVRELVRVTKKEGSISIE